MAEMILQNILQDMAIEIMNKLCSAAIQEIGLLWGLKDDLQKLRNSFSTIKAVLYDAEQRADASHEVKDWLRRLKSAFCYVDDLLDEISTEVLHRKVMTQDKNAKKVRVFFSRSNQLAYSIRIAHQVKAIRENLDAIAQDRIKFHFSEQSADMLVTGYRQREETHSFVHPEEVIGREDDKRAILELLSDSNGQENLSVLPIVGIGGLGKTTLAQLIYNDDQIKKHFELRIWICVSEIFDVKSIVGKILESITERKTENLPLDRMQEHLRREIDGKKYLLVLDDIWNENRDRWLKLRELLVGGAWGSKILLTTRSSVVAAITGTLPPYVLQGLPEEMSWSLFKKMAFRPGQELHSPLSAIGKEIVRKCAGVPLAIRVLGSFLYDKDTETEWLFVKNNQLSEMAQGDNNEILAILKLSYDHLPSHLKQCFAYCAVFGKDQVIDKQTLVQLWAAQGYIKSTGEQNQDQEQVGDQYFRDLVRRSFFQNVKQDRWGNVTSCKMHDLIHDLARLITDCEVSVSSLNAKNGVESTLHISFDSALDLSHEFPAHFLKAKNSRTILLPVRPWDSLEECRRNVDVIISSFRRLRVLDLHGLAIKMLSNCMGRLRQLRYIDLSNNDFVVLPRSTTQLVNLQTLKLSFCYDLEELPEDIHNMVSLRHLELDECVNLTHMPCGIGKLTCLRTLSDYVVALDSSSSGVNAGLEELIDLINLQGELRIRNLGCATIEETGEKLIMNKEHLQSLRLEWGEEANGAENPEQLLEVLQPHSNLKKLFIEKYRGFSFPTWMMTGIGSSIANLTKITFKNCDNCQHLPPFGQLPSLQLLKLESLSSLEYMEFCDRNDHQSGCSPQQKWARRRSADYFPSLIEMKLFDLPCLKGWRNVEVASATGEIVSLPLLSKLRIKDCPKLAFMPINPCLEELVLIRVNEKLVEQQLGMSMKPATTSTFPASCTLSRLKSLLILDIQNLISLPDGLQNFTLLEHLEIKCCPKLLHIPELAIGTLTKLRFLQIHDCGLTSLFKGMHHLTNLETLVISNCKELDLSGDDNDERVPFRCPRRLGTLYLQEIPKLVTLPIWLQDVTSLQVLNIEKCYNLLALPEWISKLSSLESLFIYKCYRLISLPLGMSCIASLQELRILMCPHLYKTCQHEGEDWPKVAHIPKFIVK